MFVKLVSEVNHVDERGGKKRKEQADEMHSIIPISDNGGSTSELIRVFGGPGIGDVRSMYSPPPVTTCEPLYLPKPAPLLKGCLSLISAHLILLQ